MAIQAQMYPENLGLQLIGGSANSGGFGSQDWLFISNNQNNFNNNNYNNLCNTNYLYNNNNNMVLNGCGFNELNNNLQQQKQQQQFQFQQQQQQQEQVLLQLQQQYLVQLQNQQQKCETINNNNNHLNNNNNNDGFMFMSSSKNCTSTTTASTVTTTTGSDYNHIPMNFSPSFAHQLEKQRQEIDRFITLQNERLKLALQEQRKHQLSTIMRKLEEKAMQLMRQKDEEISRATKRRIELEDIITKMEIENQEWQRLAAENEAMVESLNNTLEQIKDQAYCCITSISSSSCSSNEVFEEVSSNINDEIKDQNSGVLCKVCKSEKTCILLLPCRHLCCCKGCEAFVDACPVCKSSKMASIEALIS